MMIAGHDTRKCCYLIAEASLGHKGSVEKAKQIVTMAAGAGADAIKFQMFCPGELLFCPWPGDHERWPKWEASFMVLSEWKEVAWHAKDTGIHFLASVFQPSMVEWLKMINPPAWKVASRAAKTFPYNDVPGPFLVSCGDKSRGGMLLFNCILLQCKMEYPHAPYAWDSDIYLGLSDHSGTIYPGLYAMAHGCEVLEVHVSFDEKEKHGEELTIFELSTLAYARDQFAAMRHGQQ